MQHSLKKALRTLPHSPQSNNNLAPSVENVNTNDKKSRRISEESTPTAEEALNSLSEEETKSVVDAVDRELFGDAINELDRLFTLAIADDARLEKAKERADKRVKNQRKKDVEYYHRRMNEIRADRDQKIMALKDCME